MSVVREVCDRVAVMYLSEIGEIGDTDEVNPEGIRQALSLDDADPSTVAVI